MRFECGDGWFEINGCRAETEAGEVYCIRIDADGASKIIVKKREWTDEPLYTIVRVK